MPTFVIARYREDVRWVGRLDPNARIYLYNKGPALDPRELGHAGVRVINLKNVGRESGTFVHHLMHHFDGDDGDFTVFTQGDPSEHSPAFLELFAMPARWRDVQPLSVQWIPAKSIPPATIVHCDRRDWIEGLPVRKEYFSLHTWAPCAFMDEGAWTTGANYRQKHVLPAGVNLMEHFLDLCGLDWLAAEARGADVGAFSYGAIFAVRNARISAFLDRARQHLEKIELLSRADLNYGYMFERVWLHLFGEPFIRFDAHALQPACEATDRSALPPSADGSSSGRQARRKLAYAALAAGDLVGAIEILGDQLRADPRNYDALGDLAAIALRQGDAVTAEAMARSALAIRPEHGASHYALAQALARQGRTVESGRVLAALVEGPAAEDLRAESPELLKQAADELKQDRARNQAAA